MPETLGFLFNSACGRFLHTRLRLKLATVRINTHGCREDNGTAPCAMAPRNWGAETSDGDILKYLSLVSFQHFCCFCYLNIKLGGKVIHHRDSGEPAPASSRSRLQGYLCFSASLPASHICIFLRRRLMGIYYLIIGHTRNCSEL